MHMYYYHIYVCVYMCMVLRVSLYKTCYCITWIAATSAAVRHSKFNIIMCTYNANTCYIITTEVHKVKTLKLYFQILYSLMSTVNIVFSSNYIFCDPQPLGLLPLGFGCTYQADRSSPCYKY